MFEPVLRITTACSEASCRKAHFPIARSPGAKERAMNISHIFAATGIVQESRETDGVRSSVAWINVACLRY